MEKLDGGWICVSLVEGEDNTHALCAFLLRDNNVDHPAPVEIVPKRNEEVSHRLERIKVSVVGRLRRALSRCSFSLSSFLARDRDRLILAERKPEDGSHDVEQP